MRRVSVLLVTMLACVSLFAEEPVRSSALLFEQTEWNFGTIEEADGKISHTFRYRNISDDFVTIERVYSSCGCTTGEYSRRPLKAGGEGEFTVVFDPANRGGRVAKSITIVCGDEKGRTTLYIKGRVKASPLAVEDTHPYELGGGVRSDSSFKPFGKVEQGRTKSMTIALANTGERSVVIDVEWVRSSGALEINHPYALEPKESALVTLTYAPGEEHIGLVIDEFRFVIDDTPSKELFRTTALGVDPAQEQEVQQEVQEEVQEEQQQEVREEQVQEEQAQQKVQAQQTTETMEIKE